MSTLFPILLFGFFLGMRHATDSDHIVAVTTIVSRQRKIAAPPGPESFGASAIALRCSSLGEPSSCLASWCRNASE
jgi:high-affinity nickel permease